DPAWTAPWQDPQNTAPFPNTTQTFQTNSSSLKFNGVDDYIQSSDSGFPLGSSNRTAEAWIYTKVYTSPLSHIVHYGSGLTGSSWGLVLNANGGLLAHEWNVYQAAGTVPLNQWAHIVITLSPGGVKKHYINGVNIGQTNYTPNTVSSGLARIGARVSTPAEFFNGFIDDVRIYNRALTKNEIGAHYYHSKCARPGDNCDVLSDPGCRNACGVYAQSN
ncbi:MAG: LamG domain-containing protein, partial [Candidatus Pacebacteria bacterium]|nr:LamG domain-containing protein [Candidatus Paceibacterota bacterium]